MKKPYVKVTVTYEEFEMNQAIAAGCRFELMGVSLKCDNCMGQSGAHTWTVYYNETTQYGIGVANGATGAWSDCRDVGIQAGDIVIAKDDPLEGHWDPDGQKAGFTFLSSSDISPIGDIVYNQTS